MIGVRAANDFLARAERLYSEEDVSVAVHRVAGEIAEKLKDAYPVLLCVMNGGLLFSGHLMSLLRFPLDFDYLHVTRYGRETSGGEIDWRVFPKIPLKGREILIVDDILDEGVTLAAIVDSLNALGVKKCYTAVAVDKQHGRQKPLKPDFVALPVPDRFVFGYGMDARGLWRNLPGIYAMKEE